MQTFCPNCSCADCRKVQAQTAEAAEAKREAALEALEAATTKEEILAVIREYGGLPVGISLRKQRSMLPLPRLFG